MSRLSLVRNMKTTQKALEVGAVGLASARQSWGTHDAMCRGNCVYRFGRCGATCRPAENRILHACACGAMGILTLPSSLTVSGRQGAATYNPSARINVLVSSRVQQPGNRNTRALNLLP